MKRERGNTLGYFARLAPEKGFDILVDAFILLAGRLPDVTLKVAGWLSEKDEEFYSRQISKIDEAGLKNRFTHVEAPDDGAKHLFFGEIDVFSVPARFVEPKGLYTLEAMACGLPFVAPDRGIFPELVEKSRAGLLCEPESPEDLAEKLFSLFTSPERSAELGTTGRNWVNENGTLRAMAEETARVFEAALS